MKKQQLITAIELGTSTVKVAIGWVDDERNIHLKAFKTSSSIKVVKGEVESVDIVREQLIKALEEAEDELGENSTHFYLAVTGDHVLSKNKEHKYEVTTENRAITDDFLGDIVKKIKDSEHEFDQFIIHSIDRFYKLGNNQEKVTPQGMVTASLTPNIHFIFGDENRVLTSVNIVADFVASAFKGFAFSPIAAYEVALSDQDCERGTLLIDIGAGITEYVLMKYPGCYHSGQITVGCEHIANDLSLGLGISIVDARNMICQFEKLDVSVMEKAINKKSAIDVSPTTSIKKTVQHSVVEKIVELRLTELFELIKKDIIAHNALDRIHGGIRLCGGGALLPDIEVLAKKVFGIPVSIAGYHNISEMEDEYKDPRYMVPIGLLRHADLLMRIDAENRRIFLWSSFVDFFKKIFK